MALIANWLGDRAVTKMVDTIIDQTHKDVTMEDELLKKYFPIKSRRDFKYLGLILEKYNILASIVGIGGRNPVTRIGSWKELNQEFIKVGLDFVFDEQDQRRMDEVMRSASLQGIEIYDTYNPDGSIKSEGESPTLAEFIFGREKDLVKAIYLLQDKLIYEVLQFGEVNYIDNRTNVKYVMDYKDPAETFNSFPDALTGNARWDQYTTADPITDLENDCWAYQDANGTQPAEIAMSRDLWRNMLRCDSVIEKASIFGSNINANKMNGEILKKVLVERGLPPVILQDRRYDYVDGSGNRQKGRFLNQNRYVFLCENMGERAIGPTMESKGSLYDKPKTGIWVKTKQDPYIETNDIMSAAANILPLTYNPKYLFSRQVVTA